MKHFSLLYKLINICSLDIYIYFYTFRACSIVLVPYVSVTCPSLAPTDIVN